MPANYHGRNRAISNDESVGEVGEKWVVQIMMSGTSFREASEGHDQLRTKKAQSYVFTLTEADIDTSSARYQEIERILFPVWRSDRKPTERRGDSPMTLRIGKRFW